MYECTCEIQFEFKGTFKGKYQEIRFTGIYSMLSFIFSYYGGHEQRARVEYRQMKPFSV